MRRSDLQGRLQSFASSSRCDGQVCLVVVVRLIILTKDAISQCVCHGFEMSDGFRKSHPFPYAFHCLHEILMMRG